jgi:Uma2 family endonuclease
MSFLGNLPPTVGLERYSIVPPEPTEYRFSVDEFFRLFTEGFFPPDARLELLEGTVVMMSPEKGGHFKCVMLCQDRFFKMLPDEWLLAVDRTLRLANSVLEPDFMILRGPIDAYESVPQPKDVVLIVEVADSSHRYDQKKKLSVYAAAGIPEYWIVNLVERKLEVHRRPVAAVGEQTARYESIDVLGPDASVDVVLDGTKVGTIAVRDVLP